MNCVYMFTIQIKYKISNIKTIYKNKNFLMFTFGYQQFIYFKTFKNMENYIKRKTKRIKKFKTLSNTFFNL